MKRTALRVLAFTRDAGNIVRYGSTAPRFAERMWIDPNLVSRVVRDSQFGRPQSARVIGGVWDEQAHEIREWSKFRACEQHWRGGLAWEETGLIASAIERLRSGPFDGCRSAADIKRRYRELDAIYETVESSRRLASMKEFGDDAFRGWGDMLIHVGRGPELLLGRGGHHRFAMARCLELRSVPAQIGVVHSGAIDSWEQLCIRSESRPKPPPP